MQKKPAHPDPNGQIDPVYTVSQVSELSGVPKHRLRRWERKLDLSIRRDARGARIYSRRDAEVFRSVRQWREQGIELAKIKAMLENSELPDFLPLAAGERAEGETDEMFEQRRKQLIVEMREAFKNAVKGITAGVVKEVVGEVIREQAATLENNLTARLSEKGDQLTDDLVERFNSDARNNKDVAVAARRQLDEKRRRYLAEMAAKPPKPKLLRALDIILGKE
ncbi:MAG: helix-turn-helix domain-containing protein [bacterium]|jgi:DNA-binding transcriptional MerR regulator